VNKVFVHEDGRERIVQDKGEEVAAVFEGFKEKAATEKPSTAPDKGKS
jgi:hypothetical protein